MYEESTETLDIAVLQKNFCALAPASPFTLLSLSFSRRYFFFYLLQKRAFPSGRQGAT